jgi:hypothetical protein
MNVLNNNDQHAGRFPVHVRTFPGAEYRAAFDPAMNKTRKTRLTENEEN